MQYRYENAWITQRTDTPISLFTPVCFTTFCFKDPCQFTPFLNLRSLIFSLTPCGWLRSVALTYSLWWEYHFWFMSFRFTSAFSGMKVARKRKAGRTPKASPRVSWVTLQHLFKHETNGLTFRHRASCILGQAFRYSPENAFYIFNQQIYFIIWYLLDRASLI